MARRRNLFCYFMVAPALILTLVLGIYPMLDSLRLSFLQYDLMRIRTEGTPFVGLQNFETIVQNPRFVQTAELTITRRQKPTVTESQALQTNDSFLPVVDRFEEGDGFDDVLGGVDGAGGAGEVAEEFAFFSVFVQDEDVDLVGGI